MVAHSIEGPGGPGESWVTTEVAAKFVGVSTSTFLRMVGRKPPGRGKNAVAPLLPGMRTHPFSKKDLWAVEDVAILRFIIKARLNSPAPPQAPADAPEEGGGDDEES